MTFNKIFCHKIAFSDIASQCDKMLRHSTYCNKSMLKQTVALTGNTFNIILKTADYLGTYLLYLRE